MVIRPLSKESLVVARDEEKESACVNALAEETANEIRAARLRRKISQSETARQTGYTQASISRWESKDQNLTCSAIGKAAAIYYMTPHIVLVPNEDEEADRLVVDVIKQLKSR